MASPYRIGLMGCGIVAGYGHLPAIAQTPGLSLHAVYDPDGARARAAAEKWSCQGFADEAAFFASGLDAVVVTSPLPAHLPNVRSAAKHGLHVLCEKPLSTDETEGREMIRLMRQAGRMLLVGFTYRFSPAAMLIRDLLRDGAIGQVRALRLVYNWTCHGKWEWRDGRRVENVRRRDRMLEGGPLHDCGVHQIDLALWWLQSPVVRQTCFGAWADEFEAPDHAWLHMDHANGAHTMVEISYSFGHTAKELAANFVYEFVGTDGLLRYSRDNQTFELRTAAGTRQLPYAGEKGFEGMYAAFSEALRTGRPGDLPTAEDGLIATQIATQGTAQAVAARLAR